MHKTAKPSKISAFAMILLLTLTLMMILTQPSLAQIGVPQPEKTTGYIDIAPRLVGVDQQATVNLFIYPIPTNYAYVGYFDGYRGVTVTFTRPDGTKDTFMPTDATHVYDPGQTQSLGAIYFFYKPNMAGNWSLSFTMPTQNLTDISGTVQMLGCTSNTVSFTVQTDPVLAGLLNGYPWAPLPNSNVYWNYPINSNNREWNQISGDWLGQTSFGSIVNSATKRLWQPYGKGPNTGHIVWDYSSYRAGGIIGGDYGSLSYGTQGTKEMAYTSIIMDGKLFIPIPANVPGGLGAFAPSSAQFVCIDLATGQVLYIANGTITAGIHLPQNEYIQSGGSPTGNVVLHSSYGSSPNAYLLGISGSTWNYYDPMIGKVVATIVNASSAQLIDGSVLAFGVRGATPNEKLFRWNMTKLVGNNWPTGIEWEIQLPQSLLNTLQNYPGARAVAVKTVFGVTADLSTVVVQAGPGQYWGYNADTGASLWNLTLNYPTTANQEITLYPVDDFIVLDPTESTFKCYSMKTGTLLWTTDPAFNDNTWATTWTVYASSTSDNNNLYAIFPDGTARAYSLATGKELWRSKPIPSTEYVNNVVPFVQGPMILVDGKLYICAGYSSSYKINPIPRFGMIVCIDATNGDIVFTLNGGIRPSATANGYVIGIGDNDGIIYALGKGPTKTTLSAPLTTAPAGTNVVIQGSVIDMSPIAQEYAAQVKFANGVPAVSDADVSEWMDYLYMQNATLQNSPPIPTGVTVSVSALDSNGQYIDLGTTTSNYAGQFALSWKPTNEGLYQIFAVFAGSNSYFGSYAGTALSIGPAPQATNGGGTGTGAAPDNTMLLYGILAAVVIAIIIGLIAIALVLRRR